MLVLTRKLMEKLYIGDDVCVTVVRLEGGQVRLGIDAPREVAVVRAELTPERGRGAVSRSDWRSSRGGADGDAERPPLPVRGANDQRRPQTR